MTLIYEPNKRLTPVERDRLEALACRANVPTETLIDCILRRAIIQDIIEKAKGSQPPQPQPEEVTR